MSALELYKMMSTEAPPPAKNPPALVNILNNTDYLSTLWFSTCFSSGG